MQIPRPQFTWSPFVSAEVTSLGRPHHLPQSVHIIDCILVFGGKQGSSRRWPEVQKVTRLGRLEAKLYTSFAGGKGFKLQFLGFFTRKKAFFSARKAFFLPGKGSFFASKRFFCCKGKAFRCKLESLSMQCAASFCN